MTEPGSVTLWLGRLQAGDRDAATQALWGQYFVRLVGQARRHLGQRPRADADEEDVALSAFDSFFRAAEAGKFPRLHDRDDLWQLLMVITHRKIADRFEAANRLKRGGGQVPQSLTGEGSQAGPEVARNEPNPAEAAILAEEATRLLALLPDEQLRQIAIWKMEGHTNSEIAGRLDRSEPTVERKLARIRELWSLREPSTPSEIAGE